MYIVVYSVLLFLGVTVSKKLDKSSFSPLGFFSMLWGSSLIMFELSPKHYLNLHTNTFIIIVASWLLFIVGYIIKRLKNRHSSIIIVKPINNYYSNVFNNIGQRNLIIILILVGFFGSLSYINTIVNYIGNPYLLIYDSQAVRQIMVADIRPFSISSLLSTYTLSFIFAASIISGSIACEWPRKKILYVPIISAIIFDLGTGGRINAITSFFLFTTSYLLYRKYKLTNTKVVFSAFFKYVIFSMFTLLFFLVTLGRAENRMSIFDSIYSYYTGSWSVFDYYLNSLHLTTNFSSTLYPFVYTLYKLGLWFENPAKHLGSIYYIMSPYGTNLNTFTILTPFYNDFGIIGTFSFFLVFGYWSSSIFRKFTKFKRESSLILLVWTYYTILFSLVGWPFVSISMIVGLIISYYFIRLFIIRFKIRV